MELWESTAMEIVLITVPSNLQDIIKCVLYHPAFLLLRSPSGTLKKEGDMCKTYFFFFQYYLLQYYLGGKTGKSLNFHQQKNR